MPSVPITIIGIATWPDPTVPGEPPQVGIPEFPTNPIVIPPIQQPPLGIWGGGNVPFPEHPIELPPVTGQPVPPEIWGGANEGFPQHPIFIPIVPPVGTDGKPTHPIYIPVYPAHPIVLPPEGEKPEPPKPGDPNYPGYNPPPGGNVPQPVKK